MSDELLEAAKVKKPWNYSIKEYKDAYDFLENLAKETGMTKRNLERTIWVKSVLKRDEEEFHRKSKQTSNFKRKVELEFDPIHTKKKK
ncbi:hypothetical protein HMI55_004336 [Coelomomyces lativittatus]|nr:hypothetical protein HMI55_004336 [Coelomomyces lativittatus]KAJ1500772.1 hypothetical protein HMI56_003632 [Coelomomyces lativittatus]